MILSFGSATDSAASSAWLALPSLLALAAYVAAALLPDRRAQWVRASLGLGWLVHALAIAVETTGWGLQLTGARFGFAPALSVTLWLVIAVYLVESRSTPLSGVRRALAILGAAAVLLALLFPGDIHRNGARERVRQPLGPLNRQHPVGCPHFLDSHSAKMRGITSAVPPAGNGTMIFTGRDG